MAKHTVGLVFKGLKFLILDNFSNESFLRSFLSIAMTKCKKWIINYDIFDAYKLDQEAGQQNARSLCAYL